MMHTMLQDAILEGQSKRCHDYQPRGFDRFFEASWPKPSPPTAAQENNAVVSEPVSGGDLSPAPPEHVAKATTVAPALLPQQQQQKQKQQQQQRNDITIIGRIPLVVFKGVCDQKEQQRLLLEQPGRHRCFHDTCEFEGIPVLLPTRYVANRDIYTVNPHHRFCSLGCAKRALLNRNDAMLQARLAWFSDLARRFYGFGYRRRIVAAPLVETLDLFGGPYSLEEFRAKSPGGVSTEVVRAPLLFESAMLYEFNSHSARAHVAWLRQPLK